MATTPRIFKGGTEDPEQAHRGQLQAADVSCKAEPLVSGAAAKMHKGA